MIVNQQKYSYIKQLNIVVRSWAMFPSYQQGILMKQLNLDQLEIELGRQNQISSKEIIGMLNNIYCYSKLSTLSLNIGYDSKFDENVWKVLVKTIVSYKKLKNLSLIFDVYTLKLKSLTEEDIQEIRQNCSQFSKLDRLQLEIKKNSLDDDSFKMIAFILDQQTKLQCLQIEISDNNVGSFGISQIQKCIGNSKQLKELRLSLLNNQSTINCINILWETISNQQNLSTLSIILQGCQFIEQNISLLKINQSQSTQLKSLTLNFSELNNIINQFELLVYSFNLTEIEEFSLELGKDNNIGIQGLLNIGQLFKQMKKLKKLSLKICQNNLIQQEALQSLLVSSKVLLESQSIEIVQEGRCIKINNWDESNEVKFDLQFQKDTKQEIQISNGIQNAINEMGNLRRVSIKLNETNLFLAKSFQNSNLIELQLQFQFEEQYLKYATEFFQNNNQLKKLTIKMYDQYSKVGDHYCRQFEDSIFNLKKLQNVEYCFGSSCNISSYQLINHISEVLSKENSSAIIQLKGKVLEDKEFVNLSSSYSSLFEKLKHTKNLKLQINFNNYVISLQSDNFSLIIELIKLDFQQSIINIVNGLYSLNNLIQFEFIATVLGSTAQCVYSTTQSEQKQIQLDEILDLQYLRNNQDDCFQIMKVIKNFTFIQMTNPLGGISINLRQLQSNLTQLKELIISIYFPCEQIISIIPKLANLVKLDFKGTMNLILENSALRQCLFFHTNLKILYLRGFSYLAGRDFLLEKKFNYQIYKQSQLTSVLTFEYDNQGQDFYNIFKRILPKLTQQKHIQKQ